MSNSLTFRVSDKNLEISEEDQSIHRCEREHKYASQGFGRQKQSGRLMDKRQQSTVKLNTILKSSEILPVKPAIKTEWLRLLSY